MGTLIVLVGLPGSGKSTYAKQYAEEHQLDSSMYENTAKIKMYANQSPMIEKIVICRL